MIWRGSLKLDKMISVTALIAALEWSKTTKDFMVSAYDRYDPPYAESITYIDYDRFLHELRALVGDD